MRRFFLVAFALIAASSALEAKGPTVKLTLTGPGLARASRDHRPRPARRVERV